MEGAAMQEQVTILMVDDHQENLLALEAVLASSSYRLIGLSSGEDALRYILKENISDLAVILLDVQMPGMNGFETAKLIKAREKSKEIPIIFITAISKSIEHVLQGYHAGSIDYIFKPFNPDLLRMKVEAFVKLHRYHKQIQQQGEMLQRRTRELELMNKVLAKTEAMARMVGDTSVDTFVTFDIRGQIMSVNPAVKRMFQIAEQELKGEHINVLIPGLMVVSNADCSHSLEDPEPEFGLPLNRVVETMGRRNDGQRFCVECHISEANLGEHRFYVCSIRDITEKKQLEEDRKQKTSLLENMVRERTRELLSANEKLKKSQERFIKIFRSSPCLMSIRRVDDGKFIDVNESWLSFSGYEYDEVIGLSCDKLKLVFGETNESAEDAFIQHPGRNLKIRYTTKNGDVRDGLLSTEVIEVNEEKCILKVITDITEKVIYEKEVARLARLNLVGEMAAGIAHEIRNPMTTIHGFLQLSRKNDGNIPNEYIDMMLDELNRANSIITEYLTLAKNKTTDLRPRDLNSIIESLYPLIQAEATLTDKYAMMDYGECPQLLLDEKEIRQLILNLTINGIEAMPAGGTLRVKTFSDHDCVVLEISDQGGGIKEEDLEKLGTPFFTTKEQGTGLGLAVCYSIAARHGAVIDVHTSEKGTTFSVRFRQSKKISDRKQVTEIEESKEAAITVKSIGAKM
jgi:two-component system, sporulation sensor kinase E